jgi:hypothetical protein
MMKLNKLNNLIGFFAFMLFLTAGVFSYAPVVDAASLSLSPNTGVYNVGSTFTAKVNVNTAGAAINAAEGALGFNPSELSVVSLTKGSIFGLWAVEPTFSNSAGTISFGGGSPTGYTGGAGTVLSITFKVKASGTSKVTFKNGSILAADGLGTNVLTSMNGGSYTLTATESTPTPEVVEYVAAANTPGLPEIVSTSHPKPAEWYSAKTAELSWTIPNGVTSVRTSLTKESSGVPTKVYDTPINKISLPDLDEGEQYFHLQFKNDGGWGRVAHYRLAVDTQKPTEMVIKNVANADLSNTSKKIEVTVKDEASGISHYLIKIDDKEPYQLEASTSTPEIITLPNLEPGYHSLVVEAVDFAGNSMIGTFSFTISAFEAPIFTDFPNEISEEIIPVIKGMTRPEAKVTVSLQRLNSNAVADLYEVTADQTGEFVFIPDSSLSEGVFEITAVAVDKNGSKSEVSTAIQIAVQQPGYLRVGNFVLGVMSILVPLVALSFLLLFIVVYFMGRLRKITKSVTKETGEAIAIVDREFKGLINIIETEAVNLAKSRKTNKLTKVEDELFTTLKSSLTSSLKKIRQEVSEVDDIIE